MEASLQSGWNEDVAINLCKLKTELVDMERSYNDMLCSKTRMNWVADGDRNSKLFHAAIKASYVQRKAVLSLPDGSTTTDRDTIGQLAETFFSDLFNGYCPPPPPDCMPLFEPVISDSDNLILCAPPSEQEIHNAICATNKDSAPGPDGFTGYFYIACWDIIKADLCEAVLGFFEGLQLPASFSATHLFLLPKAPVVSSINQFRPISLCNFSHKIISHLLTKRLSGFLPKLISIEQAGFVPGRSMHDHIVVAHELVYDLDREEDGGNIIIKLDLAKAYDCPTKSWFFGDLV